MSFILDALKKSEAERLRRNTPGFSTVPDGARQKPASRWYWVVVALVVVNLSVLALIYMQPDRPRDIAASTELARPAPGSAAMTTGSAKEPMQDAAQAAPVIEQPGAPAAAAVAPPRYEQAEAAAMAELPAASESYATFNELQARGELQLPDMHLDIHVYSAKPEDRFVFVNMGKYKERATLDEGPVVREITPEGVILDYQGTRFLLPRE